MALYVSTNVSSLNAYRNLASATGSLDTVFKRLSSGLRINSARDDAAGLQISDRLTSQINGLNQGNRNAQDGISFCQTAEGALDEMTNMYQRIRTLAIQSANGTNSAEDRKAIQEEVSQLCEEITRIGNDTTFGGTHILDQSLTALTEFQVGANANETVSIDLTSGFRINDVFEKISGDITDPEEQTLLQSAVIKGGVSGDFGTPPVFDVGIGSSTPDGEYAVKVTQLATGVKVSRKLPNYYAYMNSIAGSTLTFAAGSGAEAVSFDVYVVSYEIENLVNRINNAPDNFGVVASMTWRAGDGCTLHFESNKTGVAFGNFSVTSTPWLQTFGAEKFFDFCVEDGNDVNGNWTVKRRAVDTVVEIDGDILTSSDMVVYDASRDITLNVNRLSDIEHNENGSVRKANIVSVHNTDTCFAVDTQANAQNTLAVVDKFIAVIDSKRAELGAVQNRLESAIRNQSNVSENVSAARSRIRDADLATETAAMIQKNMLQQASQSILSQANQRPQIALSLLQS